MIAFEYTEGWGVLLTAAVAVAATGGTLGGVALTQRSARKAERERREHELALRELELRDARSARLHDDRVAAYRQVRLLMRNLQCMNHERSKTFAGLEIKDARVPGSDVRAFKVTPESQAAHDAVAEAAESLAQALVALDAVASHPVREAALILHEAVYAEQRAADKVSHAERDRWEALNESWLEAVADRHAHEEALRDAISKELGLDD
jgi:hypothetical protein